MRSDIRSGDGAFRYFDAYQAAWDHLKSELESMIPWDMEPDECTCREYLIKRAEQEALKYRASVWPSREDVEWVLAYEMVAEEAAEAAEAARRAAKDGTKDKEIGQ